MSEKIEILGIILTNFDRTKGPKVFYSFPEDGISNEVKKGIAGAMESCIESGCYGLHLQDVFVYNRFFEIPNETRKGMVEPLMISMVFQNYPGNKFFKNVDNYFDEFIEKLRRIKNIYLAFESINYFMENDDLSVEFIQKKRIVEELMIEFYEKREKMLNLELDEEGKVRIVIP